VGLEVSCEERVGIIESGHFRFHVVGDRMGWHDHAGGPMDREVAQLQAKAGSQILA